MVAMPRGATPSGQWMWGSRLNRKRRGPRHNQMWQRYEWYPGPVSYGTGHLRQGEQEEEGRAWPWRALTY